MDEKLHEKIDKLQTDLTEIKTEIAVFKEWKSAVNRYTVAVWGLLIAFVAKTLGVHYEP